jgi:hypothetical protein
VRAPTPESVAFNSLSIPQTAQVLPATSITYGDGVELWGHRTSRRALSTRNEQSNKKTPKPPHCPSCAQIMRLGRITSRFGDLPDLYAFECQACGVSHIEAAYLEAA